MAKKSPKKPKPVKVDRVTAHAVRGPHQDGSGRWYWQGQASIAGRRTTVWSGWASREVAVVEVTAARASLGADLGAPRTLAGLDAHRGLTVVQLLDIWLQDCEARPLMRASTLEAYSAAAETVTSRLGAYKLREVSIRETQGFINARVLQDAVAKRTAWKDLCTLRTAWNWGRKARLHEEPLHLPGRTSLKLEEVNLDRPDRNQVWAVWDEMKKQRAPRWVRIGYLLGILTGARTSELYAITVGDVSLKDSVIQVPEADSKTGKPMKTGARLVFLDKAGKAALSQYVYGRKRDERLVGDVKWSYFASRAGHHIKKACRAVDVPEHALYGLRRSATDAYYDAGVDPAVAAAQLGHSVEVAQRHYRRIRERQKAAGAAQVGLGKRPGRSPSEGGLQVLDGGDGAEESAGVLQRAERFRGGRGGSRR